jgi:hypothetical protein
MMLGGRPQDGIRPLCRRYLVDKARAAGVAV